MIVDEAVTDVELKPDPHGNSTPEEDEGFYSVGPNEGQPRLYKRVRKFSIVNKIGYGNERSRLRHLNEFRMVKSATNSRRTVHNEIQEESGTSIIPDEYLKKSNENSNCSKSIITDDNQRNKEEVQSDFSSITLDL